MNKNERVEETPVHPPSLNANRVAVRGRITTQIRSWPRPVIVSVVLVLALVLTVTVWRGAGGLVAQANFTAAASLFASDEPQAQDAAATARDALAEARTLLAVSRGKVSSDESRTGLATAIDDATDLFDPVDSLLIDAQTAAAEPRADASVLQPGSGLNARATVLTSFHDSGIAQSRQVSETVAHDLALPIATVRTAMAEWKAEQERILRERYTNTVHATGWLPELDECQGSVDVTAHYLNIPTIAEHWSCGGKNFPTTAGTLITLTGEHTGTYEVQGIVAMLSVHRDDAHDLPRGYDLLYQTCQNGYSSTMSFIGLTKVE
jgi:hypothetical protein